MRIGKLIGLIGEGNVPFNKIKVARVLASALFDTDVNVAAKYNVSTTTIGRWRSRFKEDVEVQGLMRKMVDEDIKEWTWVIPGAIEKVVGFIVRAAEEGDPGDPNSVGVLNDSLMKLVEVYTVAETLCKKRTIGFKCDR